MISFAPSLPIRPNHLHPSSLPNPSFSCPQLRARTPILPRSKITMQSSDPLAVMVNGVPGRMAAATAEQVVQSGLILANEALTGPNVTPPTFAVASTTVALSPPSDHAACLQRIRDRYPRLIIVDYTHPSAANPNVENYVRHGLSFVIGTTGGDSTAMRSAVEKSDGVYAVIAPNMGKQIVAFQAMMDMMAREFPSAFSGYSLSVKESHQSTKADTSGTAKSVVSSLARLGLEGCHVEDIERVRDPRRSVHEMHVPEEFVSAGHAFHTYRLTSPDGSVQFEFQHNVCGRGVYAAGTVDAVKFLDAQRKLGGEKKVFDMIDILRSGDMS